MTKKTVTTNALSREEENSSIHIHGAREHNLQDISIAIPKNSLTVLTGISGSGKSSLAFDTIYAEGQRRYLESFSAYARQFMGTMDRPDVDKITGLSPVISIAQKTTNRNPRSTVGTITEIYDFLRLLFARAGEAYSYHTGKKMIRFSEDEIVDNIYEHFPEKKLILLAPLVRGRKGHYRELFQQLRKQGYLKVRIDGQVTELTPKLQVDRYKIHDIEVIVDRVIVDKKSRARISKSIQKALEIGKDLMFVLPVLSPQKEKRSPTKPHPYSRQLMCADTGISYEEPSPNTFSFNSPYGACPACKGLGSVHEIDMEAILPDKNRSIAEGGIVPLGKTKTAFVYKQVKKLADKKQLSLDTPIKKLPKRFLNLLLFGDEKAEVSMSMGFDDTPSFYKTEYEGIVNMVQRYFYDSKHEGMVHDWSEKFMKLADCPTCEGRRLKKESLWFKIDKKNIAELSQMDLEELSQWFVHLEKRLSKKQNLIAKDILKEIRDRLHFLLDVGLNYLTLSRQSNSLSGGESQRIRLATQIGSQLMGITYILDEPSIGLHQRDNHRLINSLKRLRDTGNTILVVEHDRDIMLHADYLVDIGPGAGIHGGKIVAKGTPKKVLKARTSTSDYLNGKKEIPVPATRRKPNGKYLTLKGCRGNNLKNIDIRLPLGTFMCITGVSGSGKSTLITETLYPILMQHCYHSRHDPLPYKSIKGLEYVDKVVEINQSPIGRTPRSNPATYCGFFTPIRQLFASLPESKIRGYKPGRFSFNVKTGRCDVCHGSGMRTIEMNFLPDVYVPCEKCNGRRYNRETLEIRYKGKSISDVLDMTVDEAVSFFEAVPYLYRKIKVLQDVGLGYITLGQSAVTLSGGEAQRVKLSTHLGKKATGKTIYILDEPTTGLHFKDIQLLLNVLNRLVSQGNTVIVIEHNMDVIKTADYLIDLGPDGGKGGGEVTYEGVPEKMVESTKGYTGQFLKEALN